MIGHMRRSAGVVMQESERDHVNDAPAPRPRLKHRRTGPTPQPVAETAPSQKEEEDLDNTDDILDVEIVLDDQDNIQLVPPGGSVADKNKKAGHARSLSKRPSESLASEMEEIK